MFNWMDKKIDQWFENRKLELDKRTEEKILEVNRAIDIRLGEIQSRLETHCNLQFEISKEKYTKTREEYDTFINDACERFKREFQTQVDSQDLKALVQECFKNYVGSMNFSTKPFLVVDRKGLESYSLVMLKTASITNNEKYSCQTNMSKDNLIASAREQVRQLAIESGLELGAKLGADIMLAETYFASESKYTHTNNSKHIKIKSSLNVTYYKIKGSVESPASVPQGESPHEIEDMMLGIHEDLEGK